MSLFTFEEFMKYIQDHILEELPEEWEDAKMILQPVVKPGRTYQGLTVCPKEELGGAIIDLDLLYECYKQGTAMPQIIEQAACIAMTPIPVSILDWGEYDRLKDRLCIRLIRREGNEEYLTGVPYREVLDMIEVCCVLSIAEDGQVLGATLTDSFLRQNHVTEDQLFEDALENAQKILPAQIAPLGAGPFLYVTNDHHIHGASAILYPGVLEEAAEELGGDFYLLPSSVHEVILVKADDNCSAEGLTELIRDINCAMVAEKDQLSDHPYYYDAALGRLERMES